MTSIVLPAVRPHLLTGVRLALGIGWTVLVPAEMLGVASGLGYEILNSRDQLAYDQVMALILVIGVLGYLLDLLARRALSRQRRRHGRDVVDAVRARRGIRGSRGMPMRDRLSRRLRVPAAGRPGAVLGNAARFPQTEPQRHAPRPLPEYLATRAPA
jgi:hypothetical protein